MVKVKTTIHNKLQQLRFFIHITCKKIIPQTSLYRGRSVSINTDPPPRTKMSRSLLINYTPIRHAYYKLPKTFIKPLQNKDITNSKRTFRDN